MEYKYTLFNDKMIQKMNSKQFKLSEALLDMRFELGFTLEEMAKISNKTPNEYIDFEYGETYLPVEEYEEIINLIREYQNNL